MSANDREHAEQALAYAAARASALTTRAAETRDPLLLSILDRASRSAQLRAERLRGWLGVDAPAAPPGAEVPPAGAPPATQPAAVAQPEAPAVQTAPGQAPGTVLARVDVTPDLMIVRVARPSGLAFEPGQYVRVGLGGKSNKYTIASAPHEAWLEHCIELVPGGRLTPALFRLRPGDHVELGKVSGGFTRDRDARHHLMVATVTGVAPFVSILRDAIHRGLGDQRFTLVHGASYADELVYRDELTAMAAAHEGVTYVPAISRPGEARNAGWQGPTGRLDAVVPDHLQPPPDCAYACGHPGMVASVGAQLAGHGVRVRTESFWKD